MKTSAIVLVLALALSVSAAPQGNARRVGGFGQKGGKGNTNTKGNTGAKGGAGAGAAAGASNSTASAASSTAATNGTAAAAGANNASNSTAAGNAAASSAAAGSAAANSTAATSTSDVQASLTLDPKVIATGFANNGQDVPEAGQVASLTSTDNFINFCLTVPNLPITNGKQITTGSCNPAPMGVIPSSDNMPSAKFQNPKNGDTIAENTAFTISMAINNMQTGFFVNAQENYFAAPQFLNAQGQIQGHSHVVVEQLDSLTQTTPTDPKKFAFFKGLNAAAQGGVLTADVTAGLPAGVYKLSSINSAANHQPVLVPIAQHGSLDDAIYFTVAAAGQAAASSAAGNATAAAAGAAANSATVAAAGAAANSATAAAANSASATAAAATAGASTGSAAAGGKAVANGANGGKAVTGSNANTGAKAVQNGANGGKAAASQNTKTTGGKRRFLSRRNL